MQFLNKYILGLRRRSYGMRDAMEKGVGNGDLRMIDVEGDSWFSLVSLESGSVLLESKDGKYEPLWEEEILNLKE